jgi:formylglycine-generating enzyme required for sulfatase activity
MTVNSRKLSHLICCMLVFILQFGSGLCLAEDMTVLGCYAEKTSWVETMLATRANYQQWQQTQAASASSIELGPWHEAGPFKASTFSEALFPEIEVKLKAKDQQNKRIWKKKAKYRDGVVQGLTPNVVGPSYLYRVINAKAPTQLSISLGSDDGIALWLNRKQLLSKDVARGTAPDQERVLLNLRAGANELLLKIYNMRGGHSFYFATDPSPLLKLWQKLSQAFPRECAWMRQDLDVKGCVTWFEQQGDVGLEKQMISRAVDQVGGVASVLRRNVKALEGSERSADAGAWLGLYVKACTYRENLKVLQGVDIEALTLAVRDLAEAFPDRYPSENVGTVASLGQRIGQCVHALEQGRIPDNQVLTELAQETAVFKRKALLANPLLDFDNLLVIRRNIDQARKAMSKAIGMASLNSHNNTSIENAAYAWDNEIVRLSDLRATVQDEILYKPKAKKLITDVDLHFQAERLMFSMPGTHERWQVFEMDVDGKGLRQLTPKDLPDVDHFDSCYLPNGKIIYTSTANYQGLPCEGGSKPMAPLYLMDSPGGAIRQLTFEQDSDWCPTVLNNGRVMYLRWEYSDTPHYFSRILFHMNPDGSEQMEYYGSGSYFPNAFFYARPIPQHPTKVVGIVGGHHGISRSGRLMILDPALGRHEADGAVQGIPERHQPVEPLIIDRLVNDVWPQFLHPYPLSDKYFIVASKPTPDALWGIYLADVFDNMTLIAEQEGTALLEPLPLQAQVRPPVIPDKIDLQQKDAIVLLTDIYRGPGLQGIPRGTVKRLRLFSYHYAHNKTGGHNSVGVESSWDIKRILGTVPVEEDGSALFRIPANTPISVQPLDEQGRALQLMRSWLVGMPGEVVSCVGCHETQNTAVPSVMAKAALQAPAQILPWQGPARPFAFKLEVEPVLDRYCVACHDGKKADRPDFSDRDKAGAFDKTYMALHPYVRRPGPESDIHMLKPMEYHASTSELIQMLEQGHHGVELDQAAWETLCTWIDLNAPFRGKWEPPDWRDQDQNARRMELARRYAGIEDDPEGEYEVRARYLAQQGPIQPIKAQAVRRPRSTPIALMDWPLSADLAVRRQAEAGQSKRRRLELESGLDMELALIPAGEYVMGDADGPLCAQPLSPVRIDKPFWMGVCEVTNAQYALFDPEHESRFIDQQWKDHTTPGYPANLPDQPVIRISWQQAMAFCQWLSQRTGQRVSLPTEAQWEWACRAGTDTAFSYGDLNADFSTYANLADQSIRLLAVRGVNPQPVANPDEFLDFTPRDERFDDGHKIVTAVGQYQANAWGLHDMHGNVAEWTRSSYTAYPYVADDGRETVRDSGEKVVRGGSWRERPQRCTSFFRLGYESYQRVYNVGFRVIVEVADATQLAQAATK